MKMFVLRKVTYFVHIFVILIKCINTESEFGVLLTKQGTRYKCVTNSKYALSWITGKENTVPGILSEFTPKLTYNNFDCDIKDNELCTDPWRKHPWTLKWSLYPPFNGIVIDRRWENMKTWVTKDVSTKKGYLQFATVNKIRPLSGNFEIPMSIRTSHQAHIFLCDGTEVPNSNCYWLILQGWEGDVVGIRKCGRDQIPYLQGIYPQGECKKLLANKTYSPPFIKDYMWQHFKLIKKDNYIAFSAVKVNTENSLIDFTDKGDLIDAKYLIIHSKVKDAFWKIHDYEYLYTEEESKGVQLGPYFYPTENTICLSMFISMCEACILQLTVQFIRGEIIFQKSYQREEGDKWMDVKIFEENISLNERAVLLVSTVKLNSNVDTAYWAIDNPRMCKENEYRVITNYYSQYPCQLLHHDNILSVPKYFPTTEGNTSECAEDEISSLCLPCNLIYENNCDSTTVCEYMDSQLKCSCSAGFSGPGCSSRCPYSNYGHGCSKQCGQCYSNYCDNVNGNCKPCKENYSGPKCDIANTIFFKRPPEVVKVSLNSCTISMHNFELNSTFDSSSQPNTYGIQFKKSDHQEGWKFYEGQNNIDVVKEIEIKNLSSDTKYFIRAVILHDTGAYDNYIVPFSECQTKCREILYDEINIITTNTTASIMFPEDQSRCKVKVECDDCQRKSKELISDDYHLKNLKPNRQYIVHISQPSLPDGGRIEKVFKTDEGEPSKVLNLRTESLTSTSIKILWNEPSETNGIIRSYIVKYKHDSYIACGKDSHEDTFLSKTIAAESTSTIISDLTAYSRYIFLVHAVTKYEGEADEIEGTTMSADEITDNEIPKIENIVPEDNGITVHFSKIDCSVILGPVFIELNAFCSDSWCKKASIAKANSFPTYTVTNFDDVYNFSNYRINGSVCRIKDVCRQLSIDSEIKTKPTMPHVVRELQVYAKDKKSISIRWKSPYPPTGILYHYKIVHICIDSSWYCKEKTEIFQDRPCKLWPDYQCLKIGGLYSDYTYNIEVTSRNDAPAEYSSLSRVSAKTELKVSEAPYNLNIEWSYENNLLLSWYHPNVTNVDLTEFSINIKKLLTRLRSQALVKHFPVNPYTYSLIYNYTIDSSELETSTSYIIEVAAINSAGFTQISTVRKQDSSPPEIPAFETVKAFCTSNDSITIEFALTKNPKTLPELHIYILQPADENIADSIPSEMTQANSSEHIDLTTVQISYKCNLKIANRTFNSVNISNDNGTNFCMRLVNNGTIKPGTYYKTVVVLINSFNNKSRINMYSQLVKTFEADEVTDEGSNNYLFALLLLLFIIPIAILIFMNRQYLSSKINSITQQSRGGSSIEILDQLPLNKSPNDEIKLQETITPDLLTSNKTAQYSKRIDVTDFERYVKESIENDELSLQHALFPRGQTKPWDYGSLKVNKPKNRYNNLVAYDHTRVALTKKKDDPYSDYINASYIDGYKVPKAYIATQGPKAATLEDFWRMIWERNVRHIIMLANIMENGKKKVEKYWPSINEELKFGEFAVQYISNQIYADYEHRFFNVTYNDNLRKIDQLHFTSWPDHGIPLYSQSLVPFLQCILKMTPNEHSPLVIHCSAGVGRTGTVILCDINLRMAAREGVVDILKTLQKMRDQRPNMVDNVEQYKLAHLVILECLSGMHTGIQCNELEEKVKKILNNYEVRLQMEYLQDSMWQDQAMKTVAFVDNDDDPKTVKEKNRFQNIIPGKSERIFICRYPPHDENSSYINAVKVDGFRSPGRFLVTQQPLPNTIGDFWRLVVEQDVDVIVSLNEINKKDKTSCEFWPNEISHEIKPVDFINLKHLNTKGFEGYNITNVDMKLTSQNDNRTIEIIEKLNWPARTLLPKSVEEFLTFWVEADILGRRSKTVLVTCYDGAKACGLYVAATFLIEKMKFEQVCDVVQAVRAVRHSREQFVKDEAQFAFLYHIAVNYLHGFQSYSNFN